MQKEINKLLTSEIATKVREEKNFKHDLPLCFREFTGK